MFFRIEEKISLNISDYYKIIELIKKNYGYEIYSERKINSVYFDNKNYQMFSDSEEGILPRKKIRIRNYPETKESMFQLEKKISSVEGRYKSSVKLNSQQNYELLNHGIFDKEYGLCKKVIKISYTRKYFIFKNIRITIDKDILYESINMKSQYLDTDKIILELKAKQSQVKEIFNNEIPCERVRFSKYCTGINILFGKEFLNRLIVN